MCRILGTTVVDFSIRCLRVGHQGAADLGKLKLRSREKHKQNHSVQMHEVSPGSLPPFKS